MDRRRAARASPVPRGALTVWRKCASFLLAWVLCPTREAWSRAPDPTIAVELHTASGVKVSTYSLEDYVAHVLGSELDAKAPQEKAAADAQAILIRTYALTRKGAHTSGRLCNRAHCQRLRTTLPAAVLERAQQAAERTRGVTLRDASNTLVEPTYFADCGGRTADPKEVFGHSDSAAVSVEDQVHSHFEFTERVPLRAVCQALARGTSAPMCQFPHIEHGRGGRWKRVHAGSESLGGDVFLHRLDRALGGGRLASNLISEAIDGQTWVLRGRGQGHGVGLCQAGALALSRSGRSAAQILSFYFPNTRLSSD